MLDRTDLDKFKEHAIKRFGEIPARCRLEGMVVDLTEPERVLMSYLEAAVIVLGQHGFITPENVQIAVPKFEVRTNWSVNEE